MSDQATKRRYSSWMIVSSLILFFLLLTGITHAVLEGNQIGADFYTFWLAGKAMLVNHVDPYSQQITLQSQMGIYGRAALPGEDQVAFAYPPYSVLAILPLVYLPFDWAYAAWLSFNLVGLLTFLFFLFRGSVRLLSPSALLLFPVFICLVTGNFSILIGGILLLFFGVLVSHGNISPGLQILCAALLAWTTVKPQFTWLFILFTLLYTLRVRLYYFLGAFFSALLGFFIFSFALVPGWIGEWLGRVQQYAGYVHSRPTLSEFLILFLPLPTAMFASGVAFVAGLALTALLFYRWWKGKLNWLPLLAWVGLFTYLFHLHGMSYDQMTFLVPLLLWTSQQARWKSWPVFAFWFGSILISWLAFYYGRNSIAADRAPVLYNAAWVAWLFSSSRFSLKG